MSTSKDHKGPCGDREASVRKGQALARRLLTPVITSPAANKYTRVDPCIRQSVLIACFYGLLRKALGKKLKRDESRLATNGAAHPANGQAKAATRKGRRARSVPVLVEADGAIGIPRDTTQYKELGYIKENNCLLYTSPSPRDGLLSRMPSSA